MQCSGSIVRAEVARFGTVIDIESTSGIRFCGAVANPRALENNIRSFSAFGLFGDGRSSESIQSIFNVLCS